MEFPFPGKSPVRGTGDLLVIYSLSPYFGSPLMVPLFPARNSGESLVSHFLVEIPPAGESPGRHTGDSLVVQPLSHAFGLPLVIYLIHNFSGYLKIMEIIKIMERKKKKLFQILYN